MSNLDPSDVFEQVSKDHSLATAAKVSAAVRMANTGRISEDQAQRRINAAYREASAGVVDPYQVRSGPDPHAGMHTFLRIPPSANPPDVNDVL